MFKIKEDYRPAVIFMLLRMMAADGRQDRREYLYFIKVMHEMGMTIEDLAAMSTAPLPTEEKLPADERERMIILYFLLFMMESDGIIAEEEIRLVKDLGQQLGFRIELVTDLIQVIRTYDHGSSPSEALLDKIRTYLN